MVGSWTVRIGWGALLTCSPAVDPPVHAPPEVVEVVEVVEAPTPAVIEEDLSEAIADDCVGPTAAEVEATPRVWQRVGTSRERPYLHGMGTRVFVSARTRLYEAGPGEPLVASVASAAGLGKKPVVQMLGRWPDDAWALTFEGAMTRARGGHKFHLWRWSAERWGRRTREALVGDGVPEVYAWTPGQVLELRCAGRPMLGFVAHGGTSPAPLERASATSFCPQVLFATAAGDLFVVDHVKGDPPDVRVVHRCAGCEAASVEVLPVPRACGAPATTSVWGLKAVAAGQPRGPVLALHTSATVEAGLGRQTGAFLLRRAGEGWSAEAVPAGGSIDAMATGPDGSLWLASDALLRRAPEGGWTAIAAPLEGPGVDLAAVAVVGEEVWLVVETSRKKVSTWAVYRSGPGAARGAEEPVAAALDLDTGGAARQAR
ncbi:MAG: hypothetical protein JNL82_23570 [Myxococcales bacterium]|nr:hypothetical protein [Myxococcales bacterium]